jgi:hypothetical protein
MDHRRLTLRLGSSTDLCDQHPEATAELPRLHARTTFFGAQGWAGLTLHWTGTSWTRCRRASEGRGEEPADQAVEAWVEQTVREANATPPGVFRAAYRSGLDHELDQARMVLERGQEERDRCAEDLRRLECIAAVAELADPQVVVVASRLLRDWAGSASDLTTAAYAVASRPGADAAAAARPSLPLAAARCR